MKYIRTKDGRIIDCVKLMNEAKKYILQNEDDYKLASVLASKTYDTDLGWQRRIAAQADTIGELCDEFVGIDTQGHYIIHNNEFVEGARIIPLEKVNYYGAIWTNKGLIYVAKMNEKGEFELL